MSLRIQTKDQKSIELLDFFCLVFLSLIIQFLVNDCLINELVRDCSWTLGIVCLDSTEFRSLTQFMCFHLQMHSVIEINVQLI